MLLYDLAQFGMEFNGIAGYVLVQVRKHFSFSVAGHFVYGSQAVHNFILCFAHNR